MNLPTESQMSILQEP